MSLKSELKRHLTTVPCFRSGTQAIDLTDAGQQLHCNLVALDTLACALDDLGVHPVAEKNLSVEQLKASAGELAGRLTYLLEPISPIELDAEGCTVQLRSSPPQKDESATTYYELVLKRTGQLNLRRYSHKPGTVRTIVPAEVTREVLLRLVGDFSDAVA